MFVPCAWLWHGVAPGSRCKSFIYFFQRQFWGDSSWSTSKAWMDMKLCRLTHLYKRWTTISENMWFFETVCFYPPVFKHIFCHSPNITKGFYSWLKHKSWCINKKKKSQSAMVTDLANKLQLKSMYFQILGQYWMNSETVVLCFIHNCKDKHSELATVHIWTSDWLVLHSNTGQGPWGY